MMLIGREVVDTYKLSKFVNVKKGTLHTRDGEDAVELDLDADFMDAAAKYAYPYVEGVVNILKFLSVDVTSKKDASNCFPQILVYNSDALNCDKNRICYFTFTYDDGMMGLRKNEKRVMTYFDYALNRKYYFVERKNDENSTWLINPLLFRCSEFENRLFSK